MTAFETLRVVDGMTLDEELRRILRPGELVSDAEGHRHRLPRFFYEIESESVEREVTLSSHFQLRELVEVDLKEHDRIRAWPRYVPCAVTLLASVLEAFRTLVEAPVWISVNGGYRSPSHQRSENANCHLWGTAVDIFRIGSTLLNDQETIERYAETARSVLPDVHVLPYGHGRGETDDHLHFDIGYVTVAPRDHSESEYDDPKPDQRHDDRRQGERRGV